MKIDTNDFSQILSEYAQISDTSKEAQVKKFEGILQEMLQKDAQEESDDKKLKEACKDFESVFLGMMYKEMRNSIPTSKLTEESSGRRIFQQMMDDELVKEASKTSQFGLADILYKQLKKQAMSAYIDNIK